MNASGEKIYQVFTDGGARGNPGPSGVGVVIVHDGQTVKTLSKYIGEGTNNQAEYLAVITALDALRELGAQHAEFFLDSELVVSQLNRTFKVKDAELAKLFVRVWNACQQFTRVTFAWIPREQNHHADALVNEAIDRHL